MMAYASACRVGRWPLSHFVKIGDTPADMREGHAAGCWCVGYFRCGNELGLSAEEDRSLPDTRRAELLERAAERLRSAGAHHVVEGKHPEVQHREQGHGERRAGVRDGRRAGSRVACRARRRAAHLPPAKS